MASDVKWIKITTDIFDDEKILLIEGLPDSYAIITVWFKLLCLAGKQNNNGVFMMGRIAYTDKMLATIFRMKELTVTMALQTFEQFGMVEIVDGVITIPNWGKHQSLDAYEKKKIRDRERIARKRAEQKALIAMSPDKSPDTSPDVASLDIEEDKDIERDIEEDKDISILPGKNAGKKPVRHKYGEYKNVLLTDQELEKLKDEFRDWEERIERLSSYMASTGKAYKNHLATIRNWAKKDQEQRQQPVKQQAFRKQSKSDELDEFYNMAAQFGGGG
jgi:predicted phage replisome organizer